MKILKSTLSLTIGIFIFFSAEHAHSYSDGAFTAGVGFYSQNFFGEITKTENGEPGLMGATSFPLLLRYEWNFLSDFYLSPTLGYTLLPRKSAGDSVENRMLQLVLPFGGNLQKDSSKSVDWFAGLGITQYQIKGKGGTKTLNNGNTTATFGVPGRSVTARTVTFNLGGSVNVGVSRFGLDLVFEGLLSKKRTQSFMLSYSVRFGGDGL